MPKIQKREITKELKDSYIDYAMSVIVSRALPDLRDGLKPVQRRILYTMHEMGLKPGAKFRKSAAITGEAMAKYHPHGDAPIYEALVRMAQNFTLRYPLIEGQGNFGSIDGDPPASMRYTEAKLSKIGEEILRDIEKNTVDFADNYDGTKKEPIVLPSPLPQVLLNGSLGIAVGMATSIPPHNLSEVVDALLYLLKNKDASIDEICQFIKGPDFPTGGIIFSQKMIKEAYENGQGPILMRGRAEIIEKKKGLFEIQITEIPYGISKSNLIEQIANLIKEKKLTQIKYLRDESDREGIKISIGLKKEASPNQILNLLYRHTSLERKFYLNMVLLERGIQPRIFSLKDVLLKFLEHRREVTKRKVEFELERVKERIHILFGLKKAILNINQIISLIKKSKNKEEAKRKLILKFKFSQKQAEVILETKLRTLSKLDRMNIFLELKEKKKEKRKYEEILRSSKGIDREIAKELTLLKERFGDERKTAIFDFLPKKLEEKEFIVKEENILILSRDGYLKRLKPEQFRFQKRGGKGVSIELKEKDKIEHFLKLTSHDEILFFTSKGRVFKIFAYEIPEGNRQAKGKAILNFIDLEPDEKITSIINIESFKEPFFLFMVTEKGKVKKTKLQDFAQVRRSGLWAIKLEENDQLKFVKLTSGNDIIALASSQGKIILFEESQIRPMGRNAKGVRGMRLNDKIAGLEVISKKEKKSASLLSISENGFAKKILLEKFPLQKRGGKGIIGMKISQKTGGLKVISRPDEKETIFVISEKGKILKTGIKEIPILSRLARGVRIIRLKEDDKVASAALI